MNNLTTDILTVEGEDITIVKDERDGEHYVTVNSVADALGIERASFRRKVREDAVFTGCEFALPASDGKVYSTACIPVSRIPSAVMLTNTKRIKDDAKREHVTKVRSGLADALDDYSRKGIAVNPAVVPAPLAPPEWVSNVMASLADTSAKLTALQADIKDDVDGQGETLVQHDSRISVLEEKTGTSQVVHPRMTPQMSKRKVREAFDAVVDIITMQCFGTMQKRGIVLNELYDELEGKHGDLPTAISRKRNSKIARAEDAGLINNLYAYAYHRYKNLLEDE